MASHRDELRDRRAGHRSRRPLLADAAIAVLARDGGRGLTHRAVDRAAAVPEGTTKNYYPTRETLLAAAAERMAEEHRAAVAQLRETTPATATPAQIRMLYPALIRRAVQHDPTQMLAMFELYLEAVRRPAIRDSLGDMVTANARANAELHHAAGVPSTPADTGLLDACLLGAIISQLALPEEALRATGLDDPDVLGAQLFDAATPEPEDDTEHVATVHQLPLKA
ncbi:MAG TPA: TetR/AcrR family transcriptional regulator [Pseudonocardiaceae bacterium]|jgi:DNA-binding transcriptional regulator YbjK|nr:TetR/AcrR family transcriptional regulator [Pseudonocardiaceae bacterium]